MYTTIQVEQRGRIAVVTLDRAERLNAINRTLYTELGAFFDQVSSATADVVVLTGAGRAFAAGADITDYTTMTLHEFSAFQRLGRSVMERIERLPLPVLAAVNGYALGGGFELALACDVIIASEQARFGLPEAKLALLPGGGGTQRLPRAVGPYVARRLLFSGEIVDARRAYELGFVTEVAPPGQALDATLALAEQILANGPLAVRMAKRIVAEGLEAALPTALSLEMDATAHLFLTADKQEGIAAFLEKRPPRFQGS